MLHGNSVEGSFHISETFQNRNLSETRGNTLETLWWCTLAAARFPGSIRTGHQGIYMRTCSGARDRRPLSGHDPPSGVRPSR
ncbi:hypothetical protein YC2023_083558 [Brassica napus]